MSQPKPVFHLLVINHKHGETKTLHTTEAAAKAALHEYVTAEWEREIGTPLPTDPEAAIDLYFDEMAGTEFYELTPLTLES